jgi:hypothetical protein
MRNLFYEKCPPAGQKDIGMILKNGYHSPFNVVKRNGRGNPS